MQTESRFMIDACTYCRIHQPKPKDQYFSDYRGHCSNSDAKNYDSWPRKFDITAAVDDSIVMIFPASIPGFEIQTKQWGNLTHRWIMVTMHAKPVKVSLNVERIEPVVWNKKAFDRLVLDPKSKELIHALVTVHISTNKMGDIISGKGNGLIILLHGSPGVGKTLTAGNYNLKILFLSSSNPIRREVRDIYKTTLTRRTGVSAV